MSDDFQDNHYQCRKQTNCLEGVCEDQCPYAASAGVKPDQQHHTHHINYKWNTCRLEHKLLEDNADHVESD